MMENIHSETYSLLIDTYIKDQKEKGLLSKRHRYHAMRQEEGGLGATVD